MGKQKADDIIDINDLAKALKGVISKSFKEGAEEAFSGKSLLKDLNDQMKEYTKEQNAQRFNDIVRQRSLDKQISAEKAEVEILATIAKQKNNTIIKELEQNAALTERLMLNAELMGNMKAFYGFQEKLTKAQSDVRGLQEENDLIDQATKAKKDQLDVTEKQAKLDKQSNKTKEKIEEATEWQHKFKKITEDVIDVLKTPELAKAVFAEQMIEKVHEAYEGFEKLSTSGLTVGQRVDSMVKGFSLMSMIGLSDTAGVLEGMRESMGTLNSLTSDQVDHVGHLAKEMGVSGQEAFGLVEGFSKLPGETMATATHAADYVKSLSKANGVAPGKITKEIAKNTELMALGGYKSAKAFTEAAMKAQKMGVELATSKNVMNGLLNFEDSINKQMEASVLLGKEINFDKARELALSGKSVEATAEVLKNIGGQAEFEKMNVLQKQALAAATGMSVEELSKAVDAQAEFNKYHGEDVSAWKEGLGYAMEYGGAVGGFLKENGMLLLSSVQFIQNGGVAKMKDWAIDKARFAWEKTAALAKAGWAKLTGGGASGAVDKVKDLGGGAMDKAKDLGGDKIAATADKTKGVKGEAGKGIKGFLKGLGDGLASIGKQFGNVVKGALALGLAGLALGAGFALALQMVKDVNPITMIAFAGSIGIFGAALALMGKMGGSVIQGALALGIVAVALIPAAFAFSLLEGVSVEKIIAFSVALPLLGLAAAGLGFIAPFIALGAISLAALGVGMIAVAGGLVVLQAAEGGIVVFESLAAIAANVTGLGGVAMAMVGIAGGLGIMAYTGLAAMPVIGALIALAAVAPALTGLGAALGGMFGGGGGEKEDKMDTLIAKIDTLISVASKGGVINMDGKKVGDIIRTSINSSGVR